MDLKRRGFLRNSALLLGSGALSTTVRGYALTDDARGWRLSAGYGALALSNDAITGLPLIKLPPGFYYRTLAYAGMTMSDGVKMPGSFDGMGVVQADDQQLTLVRNHELSGSNGPFGALEHAYDVTGGGTVTMKVDACSPVVQTSHTSLSGTVYNCAGGVTPWGTWLSCEEIVYSPDELSVDDRVQYAWTKLDDARKRHGFVFEVPADGHARPEPLTAMGQFFHEAVAVDADSGMIYLTEDLSPTAGFYRFIPHQPGKLSVGGRLQMLKVAGADNLSKASDVGQTWDCSWVDIEQPERGNSPGTHDARGVQQQGIEQGACRFIALEGIAIEGQRVFFTAKRGGSTGNGQVFCYHTVEHTLELVYDSPGWEDISGPDNMIVNPHGGLLICEDRVSKPLNAQRLMLLHENGSYSYLAQINDQIKGRLGGNELADEMPDTEWAGACFSPDGEWLFVNIFNPGLTLAITGPWSSLASTAGGA